MDLPEPPAVPARPARAPANGLKLMLFVALVFGLAAIYGQWQNAQRAQIVKATVAPAPNASPSPSPHQP